MDNLLLNHTMPALSMDDVVRANQLVRMHNFVFEIGGGQYTLRMDAKMDDAALDLDISLNGKRGMLVLCTNSVNAILTSFNTSFQDVNQEWLLFALRAFAKTHFGPAVQIHGVAPHQVQAGDVIAFHVYAIEETQTASYRTGCGTGSEFSMEMLFDVCKKFILGARPAPLENVPITLPLIATAMPVQAQVLRDMAVGDVIMLGG